MEAKGTADPSEQREFEQMVDKMLALPDPAPERRRKRKPRPRKEPSRCAATTNKGTPCRGKPKAGETLCRAHNPKYREEAQEERKRGGLAARSKLVNSAEPVSIAPVDSLESLRTLVADAIVAARRGTIPASTASAIASLSRSYLRISETTEGFDPGDLQSMSTEKLQLLAGG